MHWMDKIDTVGQDMDLIRRENQGFGNDVMMSILDKYTSVRLKGPL